MARCRSQHQRLHRTIKLVNRRGGRSSSNAHNKEIVKKTWDRRERVAGGDRGGAVE